MNQIFTSERKEEVLAESGGCSFPLLLITGQTNTERYLEDLLHSIHHEITFRFLLVAMDHPPHSSFPFGSHEPSTRLITVTTAFDCRPLIQRHGESKAAVNPPPTPVVLCLLVETLLEAQGPLGQQNTRLQEKEAKILLVDH